MTKRILLSIIILLALVACSETTVIVPAPPAPAVADCDTTLVIYEHTHPGWDIHVEWWVIKCPGEAERWEKKRYCRDGRCAGQ